MGLNTSIQQFVES
jgi:hypothetical protein